MTILMVRSREAASRTTKARVPPSFETALTRLLKMRTCYSPPILQTIFHSSAVTG